MARHDGDTLIGPELEELLGRAQPRLAQLCSNYCLSPEQASEVIYENTVELVRRWNRLAGDREEWILREVEKACRRLTDRESTEEEGS